MSARMDRVAGAQDAHLITVSRSFSREGPSSDADKQNEAPIIARRMTRPSASRGAFADGNRETGGKTMGVTRSA